MTELTDEFLRRINGDRRTVPETHQRKPDPSEPWRYVCPACNGQVQQSDTTYLCGSCSQRWKQPQLKDLKEEP